MTAHPPKLLDQVRHSLRSKHYSLATEKLYIYWIRFFIRWSGLRHPRDMAAPEVEALLTMLATERQVSSSTHRQALSAILYRYKEVLKIELPWLQQIGRPIEQLTQRLRIYSSPRPLLLIARTKYGNVRRLYFGAI